MVENENDDPLPPPPFQRSLKSTCRVYKTLKKVVMPKRWFIFPDILAPTNKQTKILNKTYFIYPDPPPPHPPSINFPVLIYKMLVERGTTKGKCLS